MRTTSPPLLTVTQRSFQYCFILELWAVGLLSSSCSERQAPGGRVGTAPTGRARPRTPPGGRPNQPNGSAGIAVLGSPASCHWHRTASRRSLPSPAQSAAAGSSADDAARNASDGRCSSADCGMGVTSQFIHANTPVVFYLYLDASL